MTPALDPSGVVTAFPAAILLEAARCWRGARDQGRSAQPSLFTALGRHDCGMLAPVFDSLMALCEAALGRPLRVGDATGLSDDEHMLIGLLKGSRSRAACLDCPESTATPLDCALCSTRIMLALAAGPGASRH